MYSREEVDHFSRPFKTCTLGQENFNLHQILDLVLSWSTLKWLFILLTHHNGQETTAIHTTVYMAQMWSQAQQYSLDTTELLCNLVYLYRASTCAQHSQAGMHAGSEGPDQATQFSFLFSLFKSAPVRGFANCLAQRNALSSCRRSVLLCVSLHLHGLLAHT